MWLNISVTKFQKSKIWVDSFDGFSVGFVMVYSIFSVNTFSWINLQNKITTFNFFGRILIFWNKGNFLVKNLCDKVSKIKNLSWQFCWMFRRLPRGVLQFFCRRCFHGEICETKWPLFNFLDNFQRRPKGQFWMQISPP